LRRVSGLREYIEKRRGEIQEAIKPLELRATELRAELNTVDSKLRKLTKEARDIERALQAIGARQDREATITIKDAILTVLNESPGGMTSNEILEAINDRFFEGALLRTSMSPQLTRLKNDDHKVKRRGERYFSAVRSDNAPE
jgi:hypothetical protein